MFHVKLLSILLFFLPLLASSQHTGKASLTVKALPAPPARLGKIDSFIERFPEGKRLDVNQHEWFYWTNYSRNNPKTFWDSVVEPILAIYPNLSTNYAKSLKADLYSSPPLPLVKYSSKLSASAQSHANSLAAIKANPSHTSPNGATFPNRMKALEIRNCAGENISFGSNNVLLMLVLLYLDEGVPDMGHRRALLRNSYQEMGVGISKYDNGGVLVVQDFSCLQ